MMKANTGWGSLQERFERTLIGRVLISIFLVVTLITLVAANLPPSRLQDLLVSADHPYLYGVALDQDWALFAPPRLETIEVTAIVTYADGSRATWRVPRRNPVVGSYTDYRWLKWAEYVIQPAFPELSKPIALYAARRLATPSRRPTRVSLTNRWYELDPPGQIPDHPFVHEKTFYTTRITEAMLKGQ
jgi:hypothetical protein